MSLYKINGYGRLSPEIHIGDDCITFDPPSLHNSFYLDYTGLSEDDFKLLFLSIVKSSPDLYVRDGCIFSNTSNNLVYLSDIDKYMPDPRYDGMDPYVVIDRNIMKYFSKSWYRLAYQVLEFRNDTLLIGPEGFDRTRLGWSIPDFIPKVDVNELRIKSFMNSLRDKYVRNPDVKHYKLGDTYYSEHKDGSFLTTSKIPDMDSPFYVSYSKIVGRSSPVSKDVILYNIDNMEKYYLNELK